MFTAPASSVPVQEGEILCTLLRARGAPQLLLAPLPEAPRTQLSPNIEMHLVSTGGSWCLLIKHELLGNCTSQLC